MNVCELLRAPLVGCVGLIVIASLGRADEDKEPRFPVEIHERDVRFLDGNGMPIEGATLTVYGMRCSEERGSHYSWPNENAGKAKEQKSDELGVIAVKYPVRFGAPENWKHTCQISIMVRHPEFIGMEKHIDLDKWPETLTMERGASIKVSALGPDGKRVEDVYPLVDNYPNWSFQKGLTSTGSLQDGTQSLLIIAPNHANVPLFSKVIKVEADRERAVVLSDILVSPGTRLFGTLPDEIPRPIEDGSVHIQVVLSPPEERAKALEWYDSCSIAKDGSFEFPSLPGPGQVQVIAICKGWVSKRAKKDFFVEGQTFDIKPNEKELKVDVEMEQTGDIIVEVMDTEGNSVVGARVGTWPNQKYLSGGSTILAGGLSMMQGIQRQFQGKTLWERDEPKTSRFYQVTDEEGRVTLRDIPTDVEQGLMVDHPDFFLSSTTGADKDGVFKYTAVPGETLERLLIMEKREKKK
jgi:hypothetical protein